LFVLVIAVFLHQSYFSDACDLLVTQLLPLEESEYDEWVEKLTEHIQNQSLISPIVEKHHIELAIQVMSVFLLSKGVIYLLW
jgi:hypothetical protein